VVALAVAAAVLSMAVAMKAVLPPPEAPLEHAEALVYVKVKPLNGSYWLGVYAPYGDVVVRQVRVNNAVYYLGVTAPVGRDTWLNASGRPLTAQCGNSVEVVTAKGSAVRSLAFTVQCPHVPSGRVNVAAEVDWGELLKGLAQYLEWINTLDSPKIAITIDPYAQAYVVKNVYKIPLLIVIDQKDLMPYRAYDLAAISGEFKDYKKFPADPGPVYKVIYLEPGAEEKIPLVGPIYTHRVEDLRVPLLGMSPLAIFVKNATGDELEVFVNGVLYRVINGTTVLYATYTERVRDSASGLMKTVDVPIPMLTFYKLSDGWYVKVLTTSGDVDEDMKRLMPVWKFFRLDRALYVIANYTAYIPPREIYSRVPFASVEAHYVYSRTLYLYVYPVWPVKLYNNTLDIYINGTPVGAGGLSPIRQIGAVFRSYGNGTYVVWVGNATSPANATYYILRPGDSVYVTYIDRQYWGDLRQLFNYVSDMGYYYSLCNYVKQEDYWMGTRYCDKALSALLAANSKAATLLSAVLKPLGWSDNMIRSLPQRNIVDRIGELFSHVLPDADLYYMNFSGVPLAVIRYGNTRYCDRATGLIPLFFPDGANAALTVYNRMPANQRPSYLNWDSLQVDGICIWRDREWAAQLPTVAQVDGHNITFIAYDAGGKKWKYYYWANVTVEVYLDGSYTGHLNYTCATLMSGYGQPTYVGYCWLVGGTIPQRGWAPYGLRFVNNGGELKVYKTPTTSVLPTIKPAVEGNTIPYFYLSTTRGAQVYRVELRTEAYYRAPSSRLSCTYTVFGNVTVFTYLLAKDKAYPISFGQILVPKQTYEYNCPETGKAERTGNEGPNNPTLLNRQRTPIDTKFVISGNTVTSVTVYQVTEYYSDGRTATYTETVTNYSGYSGPQSAIGTPGGGSKPS